MKRLFVIVLTLFLFQPALAQMTLRGAGKSPEASGSSLLTGLVSFWKLSDLSDSAGSNSLTNNGGVTFALAQDRKMSRGAGGVGSGSSGSTLLTNLVSYWKLADTSDSAGANSLTNNGGVTFALAQVATTGAGRAGPPTAGSTLLTDLQGFWKLSDTSDSIGSSTLASNGTVTFAPGKIGNAASFNGTDQWLSVADNSSLSTGDVSFSISFWVFANDFTGTQVLCAKWGGPGGSSDNEYRIYLDGQLLKFDIQNADGPVIDLDALTNDIQTGEWFFVKATYDAATDTATLQVNEDAESLTSVGSIPAPPDGASDFCIGAQMDGDNPFNGLIDATGFWKPKVFTSGEGGQLWNSGNGREHPFS